MSVNFWLTRRFGGAEVSFVVGFFFGCCRYFKNFVAIYFIAEKQTSTIIIIKINLLPSTRPDIAQRKAVEVIDKMWKSDTIAGTNCGGHPDFCWSFADKREGARETVNGCAYE